MINKGQLREGMIVRTSDDEKLGKVVRLGANDFEVEKGLFFKREILLSFDEVQDIRDDEIILTRSKEALLEGHRHGSSWEQGADISARGSAATGLASQLPGQSGSQVTTGLDIESRTSMSDPARRSEHGLSNSESENLSVPLAEEELEATKTEREVGRVRLRKDVQTEQKSVNVPVAREQVVVERVPASGDAGVELREDEVSIPVREEEVEIRKRPVVREEVRLRKERTEQQRQFTEPVRREVANVTKEGSVEDGPVDDDLTRK